MVSTWLYNLFISGIYRGYNPFTNHLLTSWDIIQVRQTSLDDFGTPRFLRMPMSPYNFQWLAEYIIGTVFFCFFFCGTSFGVPQVIDLVMSLTYSSNKWPEDISKQRRILRQFSRFWMRAISHLEAIRSSRTFNMYLAEMPQIMLDSDELGWLTPLWGD